MVSPSSLKRSFFSLPLSRSASRRAYLDIEGEQHGEYYCAHSLCHCRHDVSCLRLRFDLAIHQSRVDGADVLRARGVHETREERSNEAAMKYFLLGAFSSGVLLYGMSLLYGIAGSTNLWRDWKQRLRICRKSKRRKADPSASLRPLLLLGMIALAAGLFFKIAAVPFHMWAPDAYEGAPTSVTAFLSTGSKAASFALYARIFSGGTPSMRADWAPLLGLVAAITIMVGNWAAVTQENSKRLLAYSSISNAGYLLLGLVAGNTYGYVGLIIYLLRLHAHEHGRVRRHHQSASPRNHRRQRRRYDRAGPKSAVDGGDDGNLHVVAGRLAA